ncbi:MAG: PA14 domain-containing protein [Bacteroidia bacterium]|nr:PA14 domain-containing protein [Bacteroidia bacterium]
MKTFPFRLIFITVCSLLVWQITGCKKSGSDGWKPKAGPLMTQWSDDVAPGKTWTEYPRPQMQRNNWVNLNGLWDYAITDTAKGIPTVWDGKILVPYPIESALSGVMKRVTAHEKIWYQRILKVPAHLRSTRILLNFEAIDWEANIFIDGEEVGTHQGGYDPFTIDITEYVKPGIQHKLTISVWDPSTEGYQPVGKQFTKPGGIWYTPSSGIWQTVWMEKVPRTHITDYQITPDIDKQEVRIKIEGEEIYGNDRVQIKVFGKKKLIGTGEGDPDELLTVKLDEMHLWSPDDPYLYDIQVRIIRGSLKVDQVKGYFGMRKISIGKDEKGITRILLNNKFVFQNGPLDQGFWPDGLYTAPTEEAMKADLDSLKAMGFNMLRKHVKVEPRRFYYYTDHLGLLVWQDMPSMYYEVPVTSDSLATGKKARKNFEMELKELVKDHYNPPSIIMWVPFNEGWGQYQTEKIVDLVRMMDSSRLINNASGWTDMGFGDVNDIHRYPDPKAPPMEEKRAIVLGEYGGLGLYVPGHVWQTENWGYEKMQNADALLQKYENFHQELFRLRDEGGLSACVYTQTTDVETETNGLMTYDRYRVKMGALNVARAHEGKIAPRLKSGILEFTDSYSAELFCVAPGAEIHYTTDGSAPSKQSAIFSIIITITTPTTLKAKSFWPDGDTSRTAVFEIRKVIPVPAVKPTGEKPGIKVGFYAGNWDKLPDFDKLLPTRTGIVPKIDLSFAKTNQLFGLVFDGYLDVPETGVYQIYLSSDDGARIILDNRQLIDYDGIHGAGEKSAPAALGKGLHPLKIVYFQRQGGLGLKVEWEGPGMARQDIRVAQE